ncbi:MAG: deoxyribodipyrimidine photo-lyase, partial [Halobacteriota archaeon]
MQLFWHRRDLRAADNVGLSEAIAAGETVPVFVFDRDVLDHAAPPRVAFMLEALADLRSWYRDRGSDLVVLEGDPAEVLVDFADRMNADRVVWNHDYTGLARERDDRVRTALDTVGIDHDAFHDAIHHEPGSITTNAGEPYSVYTYFWKKWRDRPKADPYPEPTAAALAELTGESLPTRSDLGFDEPEATVQTAGTDAARDRLATFCGEAIGRYAEDRDYPTRSATSRLSTDLKFGTIGIREVYAATRRAAGGAGAAERESIEEFHSQLAWREFYAHVVCEHPEV